MIDMLEGHGKLSIRKLLDSCKPSNPQEMTDQQLNVALAELTGFPADKLTPNYCNDAAASLEVQAKALERDPKGYIDTLIGIVLEVTSIYQMGDGYIFNLHYLSLLLSASPRQRAEAAYMTLSSQNQVNTED